MSVYLEDHPPARQQFYVKRRAKVTGAIVIHSAECNPDFIGDDLAAESVGKFISTRTDAAASYHTTVDSDSIFRIGKYEWEMFHEGTGGNRFSLGLSFACRAITWPIAPVWWVNAILNNGAKEAYNMASWVKDTTGIIVPAKRITVAEYRSGKPGFISHAELDPSRRTDPGKDFPWSKFLALYVQKGSHPVADIKNIEAMIKIDWAYRWYLGRTISPQELGWQIDAANQTSIAAVLKAIENSDEARNRK